MKTHRNLSVGIPVIAFLLSVSAVAGGGSTGGGDDIGLEFKASFEQTLDRIKTQDPMTYSKLMNARLDQIAKTAKIVVVDDALDVSVKDLIQNSVVTNNPETGIVMINRARWAALNNPVLKGGMSLHEIASLAKIEQTGVYTYSGHYLAMEGESQAELDRRLNVNRVKQIAAENPEASPDEVLKKFFSEATLPATLEDFDNLKPEKTKCAIASEGLALSETYIPRKVHVKITDDIAPIPSNGPLFPGKPGKPGEMAYRIEFGALTMNTDITNYFLDIIWWQGSTLEQQTKELVETFEMGGDTQVVEITASARKNNGLITFQLQNDRYSWRARPLYGYCYPVN